MDNMVLVSQLFHPLANSLMEASWRWTRRWRGLPILTGAYKNTPHSSKDTHGTPRGISGLGTAPSHRWNLVIVYRTTAAITSHTAPELSMTSYTGPLQWEAYLISGSCPELSNLSFIETHLVAVQLPYPQDTS